MPKISNELILDIRSKINIVDVVSEYIPLVQRGRNYFGVCPFHDDHNPSMSVSPEKQIYTCFVCGASGNVFTFLMDYEHVPFIEAVKMMANKLDIHLDIDDSYRNKKLEKRDKLYDIYSITSKFYQNYLFTKEGNEAREYLKKREFSDDIIKIFEIGLSSGEDKTYKFLKGNHYGDEELLNSGLCNQGDRGIHDTFINRIMFPIWDLDGQVVGFSGRVYNREDVSKYINSKESSIFKKGKILYNYDRAKDEIRKSKKVIIVEGFMDVIALYKVGIKNVIATMGTAITSDQAQLIKKLSLNVILCFDGDSAGNKATMACSGELVKLGLTPSVVRLEDNYDPDEYITIKGLDKFLYHIENPMSLIDYKMIAHKEGKNFNNSADVSAYVKEIISELGHINDEILKEITITKLSKEAGVSVETINNILNKEVKISKVEENKPAPKKAIANKNKYEKAEQRLLFYMLKHKEVIRIFENHHCYMNSQSYRYLANEIVYFYKNYDDINIADFIAYLGDKKELVDVTSGIISLDLPETYSYEEINDYINVLNEQTVEIEITRLNQLFKAESNPLSKAEIAKTIADLKQGSDINGKRN